MNPLLLKGIIIILLCSISAGVGVTYEYNKLVDYKNEVKDQADKQTAITALIDTTQKGNANVAKTNSTIESDSIVKYYNSNPTRRVSNNCSSAVSRPVSNTSSINETSSATYASPYSPESTELIAAQLDELMKLLKADKVSIKE